MVSDFDRKDRSAKGVPSVDEALASCLQLITWAILFSFFVNLLMLTGPLYMLQLYDRVLLSGSVETLISLSVIAGLAYLLMALFDHVRHRILTRASARIQASLEHRLSDHASKGQSRAGARRLDSSILSSLDDVQAFLSSPALLNATDILWTPLFIGLIFYFHPLLGWVSVFAVLSVMASSGLRQLATENHFKGVRLRLSQSRSFGDGAFGNSETAAGLGMRAALARRWLELRREALRQTLSAQDRLSSYSSLIKSYRHALQSVMLGVGGYLALRSEVTTGAIFASSILLGRGLLPAEQMMNSWPIWRRAHQGWKGLRGLGEPDPTEISSLVTPDDFGTLLVSQVDVVAPGKSAPLLRAISFHLPPGKGLGVVGPTGSGKSALARVLVAVWQPDAGEIRLGGARLDRYPAERIGKTIGYLPQDIRFYPGTIAENIARMAPNAEPGAVLRASRAAGSHSLIMSLLDGYDTILDSAGTMLSAGQRQKIALARALYGEPRLLVLDEPSSALDSGGSEALNRAIRRFKRGGGSVVVMSQQQSAIKECDALLVLQNGSVAEFGSRHEVLERLLAPGKTDDLLLEQVRAGR